MNSMVCGSSTVHRMHPTAHRIQRSRKAWHCAISEMVHSVHHDIVFYCDVHRWCMASVGAMSHNENPCHANGRACPLAPLRASSERSEGRHLTACSLCYHRAIPRCAELQQRCALAVQCAISEMVRFTHHDTVFQRWDTLCVVSTPRHAAAARCIQCTLQPMFLTMMFIVDAWRSLVQRATPKLHVMLTEGSISPHAHRTPLCYHRAIPWRIASPRTPMSC